MSKKKFVLVVIVILLVFVISAANIMAQAPQSLPMLQQTPIGPFTQDQAIAIAVHAAQSWHEPNAYVVAVRKQLRSDFINQLKAQGDDVLVTGTGDVLIVDLTGKFTPNRVPPGVILQCDKMYVSIDSDTGDVINVGCR